jgi:hypothetical protein
METEEVPVRDCDLDFGSIAAFRRSCVLRASGGSWLRSESHWHPDSESPAISDAEIAACINQIVQECREAEVLLRTTTSEIDVVRAVCSGTPA